MKFTLINASNYNAFENLFFDGTDQTRNDILRIGAVVQGVAAGALSAGFSEGICNIRSLYTVSALRRRGIARGMLHKLKDLLADSSYQVIKSAFPSDADGVAAFFESEDFLLREREGFYQTCLENLLASNLEKKHSLMHTPGFSYFHLQQLSSADKTVIAALLEEQGYGKSFTELKQFDQQFSSAVYDYDHIPQQCLLVSANEACIFVKLLVSLQKTAEPHPFILLAQLKGFFETLRAQDQAASDRVIRFEAQNPGLLPALRQLVGNEAFQKVCSGVSAMTFI